MKPLISIITVCYNSEKTIEDTIKSVLNQTYSNIEYLLIDGNSSDNTIEIIKSYEKIAKEKGVAYKWISESDRGIYDAMNKGINMATGEFIGIINSDDWYELDAVEIVEEEFNKNKDVDIVHGDLILIENNKKRVLKRPFKNKDESYKNMWKGMVINHPTCFIKRMIYTEIGVFNIHYKICADYDFLLRCLKKKIKFKYLPTIFVNMRGEGVSNTQKDATFREANKVLLNNGVSNKKLRYNNLIKKIKSTMKRVIK